MSRPLQMWGEALQRKPRFAAHCCVGRRAQRTASSQSIFLLAGCPEALHCSICFVILQGPSRHRWQPWNQERVCFGGSGDWWMPGDLVYPVQQRYQGRVLKDGVYFENLSLQPVVHHIPKTMPFCYHSLLLLLLCLLTFSVWDFLGAFHHKRSKCHKYQNSREGAREIPRALLISLPQFWQRNWKGKLLHFTSFCPLPFLLKMYWGRNTHTQKKYKDICLFRPQKRKHF